MSDAVYRLGALAITLTACFYIAERGADLMLKRRYCDSPESSAEFRHSRVPSVAWEPRPSFADRNNLGLLRDSDVSIRRSSDGLRVVVIGDSIAATAGAESFVDFLEGKLRTRFGPKLEVWNYSLNGWSLRQEVALITDRVLGWNPDLIVVAYSYNDPIETLTMSCANDATSTGTAIETLLIGAKLERSVPPEQSWYDPEQPYLTAVGRQFERLAAAARSAGDVAVLVAIIPILVAPDADQPHVRPTARAATDAGLAVADLSVLARSVDLSTMRQNANDKVHFNHDGRVLLAEELAPHVAEALRPSGDAASAAAGH